MKEPLQEKTRHGGCDPFPACGIQQLRHRNSQLKLSYDAGLLAARSHTLVPCGRASPASSSFWYDERGADNPSIASHTEDEPPEEILSTEAPCPSNVLLAGVHVNLLRLQRPSKLLSLARYVCGKPCNKGSTTVTFTCEQGGPGVNASLALINKDTCIDLWYRKGTLFRRCTCLSFGMATGLSHKPGMRNHGTWTTNHELSSHLISSSPFEVYPSVWGASVCLETDDFCHLCHAMPYKLCSFSPHPNFTKILEKTWTHRWSTTTSLSSVRLLQGLGGSGGFVSNTGGPITSPNSWSIKTFASNFSAKIKAVCRQRRNGEETMTPKSISFIFSSSASCLNLHQCSFKYVKY